MVTVLLGGVLWVMVGERFLAFVTITTTRNDMLWPYLGRGILWPLGVALVLAEYLLPIGDAKGMIAAGRHREPDEEFFAEEGDDDA